MESFIDKWRKKTEGTLGKEEKGIWIKMLAENKDLRGVLLKKRRPVQDNLRKDKETI